MVKLMPAIKRTTTAIPIKRSIFPSLLIGPSRRVKFGRDLSNALLQNALCWISRLPTHPIQHPVPRVVLVAIGRRWRERLSGKYHLLPAIRISQLLEYLTLFFDLAVISEQAEAVFK